MNDSFLGYFPLNLFLNAVQLYNGPVALEVYLAFDQSAALMVQSQVSIVSIVESHSLIFQRLNELFQLIVLIH